jgi:hypothetical protein
MDYHQQEQRRAAAKAFKESLDQLAVCFQAAESIPETGDPEATGLESPPAPTSEVSPKLSDQNTQIEPALPADDSLKALEEAAADIARLMDQQMQDLS